MMELPPGTNAIVETGLEQAAQTLFSAADVPLARSEELLAAIAGPAVKTLLEMRIEQIIRHGHSAENDRLLPIGWLVKDARERTQMAGDVLWGENRNLKVARRRLAVAGALILAAIDRLDFEAEIDPVRAAREEGAE